MNDPLEEPVTDLATKPEVTIKINAALLEEAQRQISAPSPDAAIEEALRRLVEAEREKRRAAGAAIDRMIESGELTFRPLGDLDKLDEVDE